MIQIDITVWLIPISFALPVAILHSTVLRIAGVFQLQFSAISVNGRIDNNAINLAGYPRSVIPVNLFFRLFVNNVTNTSPAH